MGRPSVVPGPDPVPRGRVARLARRAISLTGGIARRLAGSPWARPLAKVALGLLGLVVLAGIGQYSARASVHPAASVEASLAPALLASVAPAPSPAPTAGDAGTSPIALDAPDASPAPRAHSARATPDDPVVLNTATADDLRRLPGVGEKRALAILELRAKLGRFKQVDDLLRVKGIGRKSLAKLRPLVRLDEPR